MNIKCKAYSLNDFTWRPLELSLVQWIYMLYQCLALWFHPCLFLKSTSDILMNTPLMYASRIVVLKVFDCLQITLGMAACIPGMSSFN